MKAPTSRFLFALAICVLALTGCVTMPTTPDGAQLKPNQGLVVFHVTSNADAGLSYGDYAPNSAAGTRFRESLVGPQGQFLFKAGQVFYVVPLDEGEYMFNKFTVSNKFAWVQANRFKVRANAITYIGHISVRVADSRYGLRAQDRELETRAYLAETYPAYFQKMEFQKAIAELNLQ